VSSDHLCPINDEGSRGRYDRAGAGIFGNIEIVARAKTGAGSVVLKAVRLVAPPLAFQPVWSDLVPSRSQPAKWIRPWAIVESHTRGHCSRALRAARLVRVMSGSRMALKMPPFMAPSTEPCPRRVLGSDGHGVGGRAQLCWIRHNARKSTESIFIPPIIALHDVTLHRLPLVSTPSPAGRRPSSGSLSIRKRNR
jgi:hypothetical protein